MEDLLCLLKKTFLARKELRGLCDNPNADIIMSFHVLYYCVSYGIRTFFR